MKIPLRYQVTEFDCGPTALMNAVSYLFDCETIPPDIPRRIVETCNDEFDGQGRTGRRGTSSAAMQYTAGWMNLFASETGFPIRCEFLAREDVTLCPGSKLRQCLEDGGVAVVHCLLCVGHYITLTGIKDGKVMVFDPYYREELEPGENNTEFVYDRPKEYNRLIPISHLDNTEYQNCAMCKYGDRMAVLFYKTGEAEALVS
ncbi:MAG: peptidase C39 [Oscillospiraceae bacterium]|nr:peptidase C39 [Oscillospiraceae bacterium]